MKKATLIILFLIPHLSFGAVNNNLSSERKGKYKYRTSFGMCPSRTAGSFALQLMKIFDDVKSLKKLKEKITKEKLDKKHYISSYKINYNPLKNSLFMSFDCPKPLMKVQLYKENGLESYEAILVDSGELIDPTYEVLLRSEKKLKKALPFLALPVQKMDKGVQKKLTDLIKNMDPMVSRSISEVILGEKKDLTIILSLRGTPSSVFLGPENWSEKIRKMERVVKYLDKKRKIPAIINLTNSKKVVVKFSDKF
ncbi:MAG: hypothetical protein CME70_07155 [Halobacteriovorax sp.]|nr:hypothetical protein [Halobacteriovorax sp.]|tara:strand:+ start:410770 stop:411528 length:759 start_codon:yes stop_codon:yes gene_type:complete